MNRPYLFTWTKQRGATSLELEKCDDHHFISGKRKWLNLSSLSYQTHFGLKNRTIIKAIKEQMDCFSMASPKHTFSLKEEVSQRLIQKTGKKNYKAFYTLSGSEGIENALKIARQLTGAKKVLALKNSYHGATMGALSVTGDWRNSEHLLPRQWTLRLPDHHNDKDATRLKAYLKKQRPQEIAAVCLETITGGNGVYKPSAQWFKEISAFCRKNKIFLILDEVICAAHRTGPFFGFHHYPFLSPDIIVMAKGISGGYIPFGALLIKSSHAKIYDTKVLSCGLTNYAHPLGLAATKAILNIVEKEDFLKKKKQNEELLKAWIEDVIIKKKALQARSIGSLAAIDLTNEKSKAPPSLKDFFQHDLYVGLQKNKLILAPPLTMPCSLLKKGLKRLEEIL